MFFPPRPFPRLTGRFLALLADRETGGPAESRFVPASTNPFAKPALSSIEESAWQGQAHYVPAEHPPSASGLPRLCRTGRAFFRLHQLHPVRVGAVRVKAAGQRESGDSGQATAHGSTRALRNSTYCPAAYPLPRLPRLPVLDERNRGTKFIGLPVNSVLNTPASTGMGFWSINPYVGCEFGCTYCYARDTHRWTMERAVRRKGGTAVEDGMRCEDFRGVSATFRPTALPPYRPKRPSRKRSWSKPTSPRCSRGRSIPPSSPATRW